MDRKGRQRVWDDVDIITERGTDKRTGCRRKCGVFDEDGIFGRIQTYVCLSVGLATEVPKLTHYWVVLFHPRA